MNALLSKIVDKYHGVASGQVIHAVQKAAAQTGADFSFLMEKASAESRFDPKAKARHSSATGLFQFIESTWLKMVKDYGPKHGLGAFASQITMKDGKPCVEDCETKKAILALRNNPEISALMAGEFSTENKQYLKAHTAGNVGAPELYLAHFLGASGAAKFLNARAYNPNTPASDIFPKEARSNKVVFFNAATGQPRTLDDIYNSFAQKFNNRETPSLPPSAPPPTGLVADAGFTTTAPAQFASAQMPLYIAQALSSFAFETKTENTDEPRSGFAKNKISMDNMLLMAELRAKKNAPQKPVYNS